MALLQSLHFVLLLFGMTLAAVYSEEGSHFSRQRPWYVAEMVNKTLVTITSTYLDEVGDEIDSLCQMWKFRNQTTEFVILGDGSKLPDECDRVKICDRNICVVFTRESWLFSVMADRSSFPQGTAMETDPKMTRLDLDDAQIRNYVDDSAEFTSKYRVRAFTASSIRTVFSNVDMQPNVLVKGIELLNFATNTECSKVNYGLREIEIFTSTPIVVGCSTFMLCNQAKCLLYPRNSVPFATIMYKNTSHIVNRITPFCASTQGGYVSTRNLGNLHVTANSNLGLRFNLPYYRFCGPGTDVAAMDDLGGPVDEVDAACRAHDIAYMLGEDPEAADLQLLISVRKTGSWLYPLFAIAMESKRYFEKVTGYSYTSYLYYVPPEVTTTTVHYFYFYSAYDASSLPEDQKAIGRNLENRWRSLVDDVWRGYCYNYAYSSDDLERMSASTPPTEDGRTPSSECTSDDTGEETGGPPPSAACSSQSTGEDIEMDEADETTEEAAEETNYPVPPAQLQPCRILINELATSNTVNSNQYIELTRVCPEDVPKFRKKGKSLKGYRLHVIENGSPPKLHITACLDGLQMNQVNEPRKGKAARLNYYFLFGVTEDVEVDMKISNRNSVNSRIPAGHEGSFAVILTYDTGGKQLPRPTMGVRTVVPQDMSEEQMLFMEETLQDVLFYGTKCEEGCDYLKSLWTKTNDDGSFNSKRVNDIQLNEAGEKSYASISRCAVTLFPMQPEAWEETIPTPGSVNKCPLTVDPPFPLTRGRMLQSSARKVSMNVLNFFEVASKDQELLEGTPLDLTSRATSITRRTLTTIKQQMQDYGKLVTPAGRKRQRRGRVMAKFDNFDIDLIKRTIKGYYERNKPPLINEVYGDLIRAYDGAQVQRKFSMKTFRKLLKKIGFHYGRINLRDVILQRPDIVNKRWKFLEIMRDNENEETGAKLPVVYTGLLEII